MLDKFRETAITWDKANRKVYEPLRVSAGDNKGRKLSVQVVNSGVIENLSGASLSLFWETKDKANKGLDAFTAVDATKGEFEIYYTTGMLSNEGTLNANLVLVDASGRIVSEPFTIAVFKGIDDDAIQSSDSFTALTEALAQIGNINNKADRAELLALESKFEQNKVSVEQQLQLTATKTALDVEKARIDSFTTLASGSTTGDAELIDGRIGADAITYPNIGGAIRGQIKKITSTVNVLEVGKNDSVITIPVEWEIGGYTGTGSLDPKTDRIRTVGFIPDGYSMRINFGSKTNARWTVLQYTQGNSFVKQLISGSTLTEYELPKGYKYKITYAFDSPSPNATEDGKDFRIGTLVKPLKLQDGAVEAKHFNLKTVTALFNNANFIHISSDDVVTIFQDIKTNAYASIFNHPTLAFLKSMNEKYGMVFSGYCFYQTSDLSFNLSQMPNTYVSEFEENADWLKFGAHYLDLNGGNFGTVDTTKAVTYYTNIMTELFRICGTAASLDFVPRFHNYAGSAEFIQAIKQLNLGPVGLITSEDVRQNYHLDSQTNTYMQTHDRHFDYTNGLHLFSTDLRLENITDVATALSSRKHDSAYAGRMKELLLFTHENYLSESTMKSKIESACQWAVTNGYSFEFPQNRI